MMQGFLWLLLQMTGLLTASALVFLWLGWRWRSLDARNQAALLMARVDAESAAVVEALAARDAAQTELQRAHLHHNRDGLELLESRERLAGLERELLRLSDDLKATRQRAENVEAEHRKATAELEAAVAGTAKQEEASLNLDEAALPGGPRALPPEITAPDPALAEPVSPGQAMAAESESSRLPDQPVALPQLLASLSDTLAVLERALEDARQDHAAAAQQAEAASGNSKAAAARKRQVAAREARLRTLTASVTTTRNQIRLISRHAAAAENDPQPVQDDLTRIKGIKSAISTKLHAHGVHTLRQIAEWTPEDVAAISDLLILGNRPERDHWVEQARRLTEGR